MKGCFMAHGDGRAVFSYCIVYSMQEGKSMKTSGVRGGLGPQATMDFEARVHAVSQALIPQYWNTGYPPMVVYFHRYPPFIVDEYGIPIPPLRPDSRLTQAVGKLGEMVDF